MAAPTVLVTGSTDGIGRAIAVGLARRGARVLVHGRDAARAAAVAGELEAAGAPRVEPLLADFATLAGVAGLLTELERRAERVEVLVNNAAAVLDRRRVSGDGHELTFAINHLAPFALTHGLLARGGLRRIVNVSSMAQRNGVIDLDDLDWRRRRWAPYPVYAATKLANVMTTVELARRLESRGIPVNALHPGVVTTTLLVDGLGRASGWDSAEEAAETPIWLALAPEAAEVTGRYYSGGRPARTNRAARNDALVSAFYARSLELTGSLAA